jgi:hypothetical protein
LAPFGAEDDSLLFANEDITKPAPWDDPDRWQAQTSNPNLWIAPTPPARRYTVCELKSIQLEKIPTDRKETDRLPEGKERAGVDSNMPCEYRAYLTFQLSSEQHWVRYTLNTNPVFVTLPPCSGGPHKIHMQAMALRHINTWPAEKLRYEEPPPFMQPDRPFVVNATGKGEEVLARAWCAQWGRNAVVRKECFACAVRSVGRSALGFGVLIWA